MPESPSAITGPLERSWTEAEAFRYCRRLTRSHYENFPVGSLLIPAGLQPAVHSLYAFMRTADDFADEGRTAGDEARRLAWLDAWEEMLADCEPAAGRAAPRHPVFIALRATLQRYPLPVQWLRDLLHAFRMDVTVRRYESEAELLEYCRYSANPVGRLILALFGFPDEELYRLSDAVCTGLQLANHWQDVAVDLQKDRIYLPQEDLRRFGYSEAALRARTVNPAFQALMAHEVGRARQRFEAGRALPDRVSGRLRLELRLTWLGGVRILDKIQAADYDMFNRRPVVGKLEWIRMGFQVLR